MSILRRLGAGLREALYLEHLRHILLIHNNIGYEAIVDISSMRNDANWSAAKQLFQPQLGGLSAWLVQFRRVDASESDALGPITKRVTINHVDLPTFNCPLDATEWRMLADGASIGNLCYWIAVSFWVSCEDRVLSQGEVGGGGGYFRLVVQASSRDHRRSVGR